MARAFVRERFPEARSAWLGGSVARGTATATSDLDVTVLLNGPPAPMRESVVYGGWPVEVFVHTEKSLAYYCEKDRQRRQPTMMRLVGESIILVDTDGSGGRLQESGRAEVAAGPPALPDDELQLLRYKVTDLLEDLIGADGNDVRTVVAALLGQDAAVLLLTGAQRWSRTGKGLLRELAAYDGEHGTNHASAFPAAVRAASAGEADQLIDLADGVLAQNGGRLVDGFRLSGSTRDADTD
ncbi:nucleotidyltransferase-like protein [Kribbella orskensis]|uniref:Nucleotidyltransferase-like protein n=1 Tax=Kribbella orskensis TaxID=2512216 RepID=A0ABY2BB69_9ACTN|nr:nucleotidyltransferase-like protein [Kribbella sp. VKM Ac-2500]TCO14045.1 nucleotidyltransferase-like protein [Kribbella orskensis]